jgi:predicted ATPase
MINRVLLRNFKCFESQEIRTQRLTLLAGLNGMGKSSVLQAILLLRQSYLDGLLPDTGLELNGPLVRMGTARDVLYEDAQEDEFEIGIAWSDGLLTRFVLQYSSEADVLKIAPPSVERVVMYRRIPFTDWFHYLQAERIGPRTINAVSDFQVRDHRQLGTAGEYVGHFLHLYGAEEVNSKELLHPGASTNTLHGQVQAWLREISPGAELHLAVRPEMDLVNLRFSFVTGEQRSNEYRATAVGFGIAYALPVLVALLSSTPESLVLIENPEAHLHPQGQVRVGELIARAAAAGAQVIVETHSDHVLNGIRVAVHSGIVDPGCVALHYFSRMEEGGRVHSRVVSPVIDRNGRLDMWPEGFFDEWDRSLDRLLAPGGQ